MTSPAESHCGPTSPGARAAGRLLRRACREPLADLAHPPPGQVPALDALRACAVLMVICRHASGGYLDVGGRPGAWANLPFVRGGWMGVDLFFVLSGYLIGKQLWRELRDTGTIRFGRFFLRRGFRIWPLYFFFLAFCLLVVRRGRAPLSEWWSDALFLTNYFNRGIVPGSWSLCTEEQFYILTPLAVLLGASCATPLRRYRAILLAAIVALPAIRAAEGWALTGSLSAHDPALVKAYLYTPIHAHADGLFVGLFLAHLEVIERGAYKSGAFGSIWVVVAGASACAGLILISGEVFNYSGVAIFFGSLVWYLLARPRPWLAWLDARIFYVLSRLSFGMYLNHQLMNQHMARLTLRYVAAPWGSADLHTVLTTAILATLSALGAVATFCLVEHPFLRMREVVLDGPGRAAGRPAPPVVRKGGVPHIPAGSAAPDPRPQS